MATVNFSVPNEVKRAFDWAFEGENESAAIARLMRQAAEGAGARPAAVACSGASWP